MGLSRVQFRLLLLICCVIVATSYRLGHHPLDERMQRAVTEWRFRRNFLLPLFSSYPNYADEHFGDNEEVDNDNDGKAGHPNYLSNLIYDPTN